MKNWILQHIAMTKEPFVYVHPSKKTWLSILIWKIRFYYMKALYEYARTYGKLYFQVMPHLDKYVLKCGYNTFVVHRRSGHVKRYVDNN